MHSTRRLIRWVAHAVGALRPARAPEGLRILLYHSIGGDVSAEPYNTSISPDLFREQMRWLRQDFAGDIVSLEEGIGRLRDGIRKPSVAITFDDGYRDNLTIAGPILAAFKIPFTVFVTPSYVQSDRAGRDRYLTPDELRRMSCVSGASIGAHGYSHRPLTRLGKTELRHELTDAKLYLEQVIERPVMALSYPHGATNKRVREAARSAGYTLAATSLIGVNRSPATCLMLRRTEVLECDQMEQFQRKVRGDYDWYRIKQQLYWPLPRG